MLTLGTERPIGDEKYLCAIDFLSRPTGTFAWPWQAVYIGTKNCDIDLLKGQISPKYDIRYVDGCPISLYPIRDWSDDEVYEYLEVNGVMPDTDRYEKVDGTWGNKADKSKNADYIPTCLACIDKSPGDVAYCQKLGCNINKMTEKAPYEDIVIPDLGFDALGDV